MLLIRRVSSVQQNALALVETETETEARNGKYRFTAVTVLWKVLYFVSSQTLLATRLNVVQGECDLLGHLTKYIVLV